ncbi:O-antigen polymerase [Polynucleobacter sp. UK-Gri1-W3]|uniref:O-antigen polymerase n=1 Tax=Polynucleobacter sp. UK-Gri1-W3 TaxID=1819737 RepID=UPI001C0AF46B|nr:O-antigen polymerase [Polynucleobacter sp. UK-Gri1-W3]MBU3538252.1 oligosaccharide repeat unit polymerase [Polynucleobacter sp. UK-Gri1-W3]
MNIKLKKIHYLLFFLGWVYYIFTPILILKFPEEYMPENLQFYYGAIHENIEYSMVYGILILIFFLMPRYFRVPILKIKNKKFSININLFIQIFIVCIQLIYIFIARDNIFQGYTNLDALVVGPINTIQLIQTYLHIINSENKVNYYINNTSLIVNSIVLLGMGGRLYVIMSIISILTYELYFGKFKKISKFKIYVYAVIFITFFSIIGIIRNGGHLNLDSLLGGYIFEPIFISYSGFTIFNCDLNLFSWPSDYLSGFKNIIPSFIWPDKINNMLTIFDTCSKIESPQGGMSIVASTIASFGLLGGLCYVFIFSYILKILQFNLKSKNLVSLYMYLIGILPFMFFRDPFIIQVKVILLGFALFIAFCIIAKSPSTIVVTNV